MGALVAMTLPPSRTVGLGECAKVVGATAWHEQGYISAQKTPAQEDIFGFADAATAAQAYAAIAAGLNGCQQTSRDVQQGAGVPVDATVAATATTAHGLAWSRTWTGVPGASLGGAQINHYYLVRHDTTIIIAAFTELGADPAHRYDTAGDSAVLTMLADHSTS
ncbi:hypothetical protein ACFQ9X_24560 [Catenulispora yoronensis]